MCVSDLKGKGRNKKRARVESESDSDPEPPLQKKRHGPSYFLQMKEIEDQVCQVAVSVVEMKKSVEDLLTFSSGGKVPIWFQRLLRDTFKCKICLSVPIKPPVIMMKCCKTILGCETCSNKWYSGEEALTKTCPSNAKNF